MSAASMRKTAKTVSVRCRSRLLLRKNIPMPVRCERGSGCFLKHAGGGTKKPVSRDGIILIFRLFRELCMKPFYVRVFRSLSAVIRLYVSPLICNASTGIRLRYPHYPRASRSQRCFNHYGLHPRPQARQSRRSKPPRSNVILL